MNWYKKSTNNNFDLKISKIITRDELLEYAKKFNRSWSEIQNEYDQKYGENHHHLRLICMKCHNEQTCRCREPKITEIGMCNSCYSKHNDKKAEMESYMSFLKEASWAGFLKGFIPMGVVSVLVGLGLSMTDLQNKPVRQIKQEIVQKAEEKGYDQETIEKLVNSIEDVTTQYAYLKQKPQEAPQTDPEQQPTLAPTKIQTSPKTPSLTKEQEQKKQKEQKDQFNDYFSKKLLDKEGSKNKMYDDGRGYATIGIGHMMGKIERDAKGNIIKIIPNERSKSLFAKLFVGEKDASGQQIDFNKILWGKQQLSQDQIKKLVISDIGTHEEIGKKLFPKLDEYPAFVKAALLNGVYRGEFKKDYKVVKAINAGDFKLAADLYLQRYDYKNAKKLGISGIIPRMNENKAAMLVYAMRLNQLTKEQCVKELAQLGYKLK